MDKTKKECWIVDIGEVAEIVKLIDGYYPNGVLLTHTHYDHIYGLNKFIKLYPSVIVYTNAFGRMALSSPIDNLSAFHDDEFVLSNSACVCQLEEGDRIMLGLEPCDVIETPGHDKSCLTYIVGNWIFTGDSYIPGCEVFTKLQNSDKRMAQLSVDRILYYVNKREINPGHIIIKT